MSEQQLQLIPPTNDVVVDYVPFYSKEECLLGYEHNTFRGKPSFGCTDANEEERIRNTLYHAYSLKFEDAVISPSPVEYASHYSPLRHVIHLVNEWRANKLNKDKHPKAWNFINQNGAQLSADIRYYLMKDFEQEVISKEEELRKMKLHLNLDRYEVNARRVLTKDERLRLWVEFGG